MLAPKICAAMLERYEAMLAAAKEHDIERLSALESELAKLRDAAARDDTAEPPTEAEQTALKEQIARMLALDAEIRAHVEPLRADIKDLLTRSTKDRAVRAAYGAFGP